MKTKILFIVPSLKNAGPVNVCLTLINNLPAHYDISVLALNEGELNAAFSQKATVTVFKRTAIYKILSFIRKGKFAVIHSHCTISDIMSYLSFSSAAKVTTIHNYFEVDFIQTKGWLKGKVEAVVGRFVIRHFYKVACSQSVLKHCLRHFAMKNLSAIANGVDPLPVAQRDKPDGSVDFFYLGVLNKRKNAELIVAAFQYWCSDKQATLHIIGSGPEEPGLREQYHHEKIVFHGSTAYPWDIYRYFDCFISASHAEGLPLALLESLSAGKAFICSDIEPHKEVLEASAQPAGMLFDRTRDGLIACLDSYYFTADKSAYSTNALDTWEKNYSAKHMAMRYSSLYQQL